jgi:hypothetical protein
MIHSALEVNASTTEFKIKGKLDTEHGIKRRRDTKPENKKAIFTPKF